MLPVSWPSLEFPACFATSSLQFLWTTYPIVHCCLEAVVPVLTLLPEAPPLRRQALWNVLHSTACPQGIATTSPRNSRNKCVGGLHKVRFQTSRLLRFNRSRLEIIWITMWKSSLPTTRMKKNSSQSTRGKSPAWPRGQRPSYSWNLAARPTLPKPNNQFRPSVTTSSWRWVKD